MGIGLGKTGVGIVSIGIGSGNIGSGVNIGAGTVTANFDGKKKSVTVIKDKAFIGSDTVLVAPVKVGKSGSTGAGSVVLKNSNVGQGQVVAGVPARPISRNSRIFLFTWY